MTCATFALHALGSPAPDWQGSWAQVVWLPRQQDGFCAQTWPTDVSQAAVRETPVLHGS